MSNILITGGCGFIGSNFINYIYNNINNINKIVNLDIMYYCASEQNINKNIISSEKYIFIKGNINNSELINSILEQYNINIVIHFAAQTSVDYSFINPYQFTLDNVCGTHNLLECCRQYGKLDRFIHISTDEVYGESDFTDTIPKDENTILAPSNPYAASKVGAESIAFSYYKCFNVPIIITRCNNAFGPNQYPEKLIPKFINLLKNNKKVTIHGKGNNLRTFIHTEDISKAIYTIWIKGIIGEIYNIGSESELSIKQVTEILIKKIINTDNYDNYIEYIDNRIYNDKRYFINFNKLQKLGWTPCISFESGINQLI